MATANTLIEGAATMIGIKSASESLEPAVSQDAFRRLNQMVAGLKAQTGTILAIERQIFNLNANQQWYSIGPGGDFNVTRPQTLNGAGLLLNGLTSARSCTITRSGTTATVTLASHGFAVGQEVIIQGCTEQDYNQSQIVTVVPTANTFQFEVFGSPVTPATGSPTVQAYSSTAPVEIPRAIMTDDAYQAIQVKTLTNGLFTSVYYQPTQPLGQIFLWPMPNVSTNQLVLYLQTQFDGFADLFTDYTYPDTPGYADMLESNLALRIAAPNGVANIPPAVVQLAGDSMALVKRANVRIVDLPNEMAWSIGGNRRFGYNINTNQGG